MRFKDFYLNEKYDLYHKDFSGAMQHAYDYAKKKMGITVDPKEIDSKVATGPKKPTEGKTNKYRLKGKKQMIVNRELFTQEKMQNKLESIVDKMLDGMAQKVELKLPKLQERADSVKLKLPTLKKG